MTSTTSLELPPARTWTVGDSVFIAYPTDGARLASWKWDGQPIIHWPDQASPPLAKVRGGNPVLFPFSGRTYADGEEGQWLWSDALRPMPRHGFARGGAFDVVEDATDGFTARLVTTDEDHTAYPFEYEFRVQYRFESDAFEVTFFLENRDHAAIPWSAGHHFYFSLAVSQRRQAFLHMPDHRPWYHGADGQLVTAEALPISPVSFDEPKIVDRIHTHLSAPEATFGPIDGGHHIRVAVTSNHHEWTTMVSWTQADDSPFYCVEPWMGPPNGPGHGLGIASVAPGETGRFVVRVERSN